MKTLDTLTKDMLKKEYHLTDAYIKRHAKELGALGKPMIFDRELVELHLREKIWEGRISAEDKKERAMRLKEDLLRRIETVKGCSPRLHVT